MIPPISTERLRVDALTLEDSDDLVDMLMKRALYTVIGDAPVDFQAAYERVARWVGDQSGTSSTRITTAKESDGR